MSLGRFIPRHGAREHVHGAGGGPSGGLGGGWDGLTETREAQALEEEELTRSELPIMYSIFTVYINR